MWSLFRSPVDQPFCSGQTKQLLVHRYAEKSAVADGRTHSRYKVNIIHIRFYRKVANISSHFPTASIGPQ